MSAELRDAAIAEIMGDVASLHQSVKDLVAIIDDADRRISARVLELRALASDLTGTREALLAQLAVQASAQGQRVFKECLGELLGQVHATLERIDYRSEGQRRVQWLDRAAIAIVTGTLGSVLTLGGVWLMLHFH